MASRSPLRDFQATTAGGPVENLSTGNIRCCDSYGFIVTDAAITQSTLVSHFCAVVKKCWGYSLQADIVKNSIILATFRAQRHVK
jgi:hypothetical protein